MYDNNNYNNGIVILFKTYGDHVELGYAVLFDREWKRDAVLFNEHFLKIAAAAAAVLLLLILLPPPFNYSTGSLQIENFETTNLVKLLFCSSLSKKARDPQPLLRRCRPN